MVSRREYNHVAIVESLLTRAGALPLILEIVCVGVQEKNDRLAGIILASGSSGTSPCSRPSAPASSWTPASASAKPCPPRRRRKNCRPTRRHPHHPRASPTTATASLRCSAFGKRRSTSRPTLDAMRGMLPKTFGKRLKRVRNHPAWPVLHSRDIDVHAFAIPHDAADPIGFTFSFERRENGYRHRPRLHAELVKSISVAPIAGSRIRITISTCSRSPYPWVVKQRVLSRTAIFSNHAVSEYLAIPTASMRSRAISSSPTFLRKTTIPISSASR